jgi:hypothetical protein
VCYQSLPKHLKECQKSNRDVSVEDGQNKITIMAIQGHYGGAIRGNVGNLGKMETPVMAIWKHWGVITMTPATSTQHTVG